MTPARWILGVTATVLVIAALTAVYTRLSMTIPVGSDQANSALQGQDLAAGNLLLRGWIMSPLSLYVPDLVLYAAVITVAGFNTLAVHITNALMYAFIVVSSVALARGPDGRRPRNCAALITGLILVAPQLGLGADLLVLEGSHAGVALLTVLALIVIDRGPADWRTALITGVVLTVACVADGLAIVVALAPLAAVSAYRLSRGGTERGFDSALFGAAVLAFPAAQGILFAVRRLHGFRTYALSPGLASPADLPTFGSLVVKGLAAMLGVDVTAAHNPIDYFGVALHLAGAGFAAVVIILFAWGLVRGRGGDRVSELLLIGIASNLGAFLLTTHQATSRYLIPCFVFGAVLAGRAGADHIATVRLRWPLAALAAGYLAVLVISLGAQPAPTIHPWSAWLAGHQLYHGLGSYWQASSVTLETKGKVQVRPILSDGKQANGYAWESKLSWYTVEQLGDTRFVIYDVTDHQFGIDRVSMEVVFGPPAATEDFGNVQILVWDHNLVPYLTLGG